MTNRSRLAEILGLEEDEEYTVKEFGDTVFRIHNGERQHKDSVCIWRNVWSETSLTAIINDPSLIIRKPQPRFTDEEMTLLKLLHKYGKLKRMDMSVEGFMSSDSGGNFNYSLNIIDHFLNPGENIDLDELFKEDEDGRTQT